MNGFLRFGNYYHESVTSHLHIIANNMCAYGTLNIIAVLLPSVSILICY